MRGGKRIVRALAAVGAIALLLVVGGAVYGALLVRRGFSALDTPSALEVRAARALRSLSVPASARALENPLAASPELLREARAHWADHCASCHANDGSGRTSLGQGLSPRAPDMRADATQRLSDGELYYVIQNGVRLTGMPGWGKKDELANRDSWALVHFVRQLPHLSARDLEELKGLNPRSAHELREREEEEDFLNAD